MGEIITVRWQELVRTYTEYLGGDHITVTYGNWSRTMTEQMFDHELRCGTLCFDQERQVFIPAFKDVLFGTIIEEIAKDTFFTSPVAKIPERMIEKSPERKQAAP